MFGRASSATHVCLRCRSRLIKRPRLWFEPSPFHYRHQSTLAAQSAEPEANGDDPGSIDSQPNKPQPRPRIYRDKHWRPAPTKDLGVDSLGTPAEILVLPERKKRPSSRKEEDADLDPLQHQEAENVEQEGSTKPTQLNVQESLAQELRPITIQEVNRNIEIIRDQIGGQGTHLSPARWSRARNSLRDGFTKDQLRRYIQHNLPIEKFALKDDPSKLAHATKKDVAAWLLHSVWDIQSDHPQATPAQPQKSIVFSGQDLDIILRGKAQHLADIASQFRVKIDVFRNEARMRVTGSREDIEKVANLIRDWKSSVLTVNHVFPKYVVKLITPEDLSRVGELHGVVIALAGTHLVFSGFDLLSIAAAYRDLYINTFDVRKQRQLPPIFVADQAASAVLLPVHQPPSPQSDRRYRFRYLAQHTTAEAADPEHTSNDVSKSIDTVVDAHLARRDGGVLLQPTWSVNLAETIWKSSGAQRTESTRPASVNAITTTEIPRLLQYLKRQVTFDTSQCQYLRDLTAGDQELYRLRFTRPHRRSIEMYLSRPSPLIDGTVKPLQLRQLYVVVQSNSSSLLLPNHLVDLNVTTSEIVPIFSSGVQLDPDFAPILAQVASYLDLTSKAPDLSFAATLDMDLSSLYRKAEAAENGMAEATGKPSYKVGGSQLDQTYILQRAERVERVAFLPPSGSHCILEHLSFQPLPSSLIQEPQQILQLVNVPLCHVSVPPEMRISTQTDSNKPDPAQSPTDSDYSNLTKAEFMDLLEYGSPNWKATRTIASDGDHDRQNDLTPEEAIASWKPDTTTTQQKLRTGMSLAYTVVEDLTRFARGMGSDVTTQAAPNGKPSVEQVIDQFSSGIAR